MEAKPKPAAKDKRRNNEKRKEKSRDAARCRRSRETEIFTELANSLPLAKDQISQLDKVSIMRIAISYLRVRDMIDLVPEVDALEKDPITNESWILKTLEGFALAISPAGDFIYVSENVNEYIGITQVDLLGQNIYEYTHPCDHDEIKEMLDTRSTEDHEYSKSFFIRFKCTLTSKGRSVNLKSATYKVIHCKGHMVHRDIVESDQKENEAQEKARLQHCLVAIGQPIPHPSNIEAPLGRDTFLTKHSLDMKFTYADEMMLHFMDYNSDDLIGKSLYDYHHAMDSDAVCSAFKCLFSKGQCQTSQYRFLAKTGGYVWVVTQATLIYDKMQKPQSVVCVNYLISEIENKDQIYSVAQAAEVKLEGAAEEGEAEEQQQQQQQLLVVTIVDKGDEGTDDESIALVYSKEAASPLDVESQSLASPPRPQTATSKIFAPRTEEMSKGFLMFSDEEPGLTMLKDEPDDLTHLAPVAGDVCVPLEEHPFLSDMLDDFLLRDSFGPLLADEPSDPFISYRDSCDPSPQLLSPNLSKHSESSLPSSLNSPGGSLGDEDQMSTFMSLQMDEEDPELLTKAPYIPMNIGDDLPLLMSDDILWNGNSNEKSCSSTKNPDINSSLAQLLCSNINKQTCKTNDHGGGLIQSSEVLTDLYNEKNSSSNMKSSQKLRVERSSSKRLSATPYQVSSSKRYKNESKEKMSSELLQQLMSSNTNRGRPKGKSNWLLDSGQKATCISQPSESVLMNLLDDPMDGTDLARTYDKLLGQTQPIFDKNRSKPPDTSGPTDAKYPYRKNSFSLLNSDATAIGSLLVLSQQDFEVNAPVNSLLLQGRDLLTALEIGESM